MRIIFVSELEAKPTTKKRGRAEGRGKGNRPVEHRSKDYRRK